MPYTGGSANTVAMLPANGAVLPKSIAQNGQMTVTLSGPVQVLLTDNPKQFSDTAGHWAEESISFVTSHGLFQGVSDGIFSADGTMTRAMLWTVLARLEGADTSGGAVWYEKGMEWAKQAGISGGSNPDGSITREQLAAMLWRVVGSPASDRVLEDFHDTNEMSDYAEAALRWAVEQGVVSGKGDGVLDPKGNATRAQVSAMLMRFIGKL